MVNPLDTTLEAFLFLMWYFFLPLFHLLNPICSATLQDYDKIIKHLEDSISDMINAVVIFQKFEKALWMTLLSQNNYSFCTGKMQFHLNVLQLFQARSLSSPVWNSHAYLTCLFCTKFVFNLDYNLPAYLFS